MISRNGILFGLAAGLTISTSTASAIELVRYDFVAGSPAATTNGAMTGTDVVFGAFTSPGSSPSIDGLGVFVEGSDTNTAAAVGASNLADAIATGDYISFTVGSTSASPFSISDISFTYSAGNNSGFILSSHLLTSATGFSASDSLVTTEFVGVDGSTPVSIDVSGNPALQNLVGPVEVRVYFSDSTFSAAPDHRVDDIIIEGIPEPSTLALLGLSGLLIARRRRG